MARKFSGRDLGSLIGLNSRKLVLDNIYQYVYNPGLFSNSILSILLPSSGFYSSVDKEADRFTIGQIFLRANDPTARVIHLAPVENKDLQGLSNVVSHLIHTAGEKGALQLIAEVDNKSSVDDLLEQIGFRSYTEQQIWKLPRRIPTGMGAKAWLPTTKGDAEQVKGFYQRVVPANILRAEPPPEAARDRGLICWTEGRICGYAKIHFGPRGILVDLILSPSLSNLEEYLSALIFHMPYRETRTIYLRVRSYQGRLATALETVGAEAGPEQKALVKRLAVHYNAKQTFRVQSFENQPDVTTPISNSKVKN
jgi:hypothetical protein